MQQGPIEIAPKRSRSHLIGLFLSGSAHRFTHSLLRPWPGANLPVNVIILFHSFDPLDGRQINRIGSTQIECGQSGSRVGFSAQTRARSGPQWPVLRRARLGRARLRLRNPMRRRSSGLISLAAASKGPYRRFTIRFGPGCTRAPTRTRPSERAEPYRHPVGGGKNNGDKQVPACARNAKWRLPGKRAGRHVRRRRGARCGAEHSPTAGRPRTKFLASRLELGRSFRNENGEEVI